MARKINTTMTDAMMLVGGGVVGAGLALLFAPQAGSRTRREIVRFGKAIGSRSDKAVHDFADTMTDFTNSVGRKASDILQNGQQLTREGKKGILTAIEKGQETLEHQKRRVARMMG